MGLVSSLIICLKRSTSFIFFTSLRLIRFTLLSIFLHPSINPPLFLGKRSDGTFPLWSRVIFCPLLCFIRAFSTCVRFIRGEDPYSEVSQGLYVGGCPYSPDKLPPRNPAIIDCTCELSRKREFLGHAYLCIPVWDTRAPTPAQIESAVKFAFRERARNVPVFIHCAYGICYDPTLVLAFPFIFIGFQNPQEWQS